MAATVANLQTTVGRINTWRAKMDQLLNAAIGSGNRNDCAMGVGRDSNAASDAEADRRKKVKVAEGQASGAVAASASASA